MGHVFEVDQPTTQSGKRRRMAELGWTEPPGLHFVPVDLSKESLSAALARGSFDTKAPAFFSWLGVIHYLERDAVLATMRSIAEVAHPGSELVFDYFEADAFVREKQALRVHFTPAEGERVGEPLKGGLDPATLAATLAAVGLRLREDLGPPEIQRQYFDGRRDGYYAFEQGTPCLRGGRLIASQEEGRQASSDLIGTSSEERARQGARKFGAQRQGIHDSTSARSRWSSAHAIGAPRSRSLRAVARGRRGPRGPALIPCACGPRSR